MSDEKTVALIIGVILVAYVINFLVVAVKRQEQLDAEFEQEVEKLKEKWLKSFKG